MFPSCGQVVDKLWKEGESFLLGRVLGGRVSRDSIFMHIFRVLPFFPVIIKRENRVRR